MENILKFARKYYEFRMLVMKSQSGLDTINAYIICSRITSDHMEAFIGGICLSANRQKSTIVRKKFNNTRCNESMTLVKHKHQVIIFYFRPQSLYHQHLFGITQGSIVHKISFGSFGKICGLHFSSLNGGSKVIPDKK